MQIQVNFSILTRNRKVFHLKFSALHSGLLLLTNVLCPNDSIGFILIIWLTDLLVILLILYIDLSGLLCPHLIIQILLI